MINNLTKILPLLTFEEGYFYYVVILKRKKEHPELGSNSYVVKHYFIKDEDDFLFYWGEMLMLCDYHNARLCINLNRRSFEALAYQTIKKVADQVMNKDFRSVRKAFTSVCGAYSHDSDKKWIIDVDYKEANWLTTLEKLIDEAAPLGIEKNLMRLPTKNGYHLITRPFNVQEFQLRIRELREHGIINYDAPDIQKNNPTIVYIPEDKNEKIDDTTFSLEMILGNVHAAQTSKEPKLSSILRNIATEIHLLIKSRKKDDDISRTT